MSNGHLLDLLLEAASLKRLPRTGWAMRGASPVESVADHSHGVALLSLILVDALQSPDGPGLALDLEKVLVMAVLHDLAEVRLTDLPASAIRLLPDGVKRQAEASALDDLLAPLAASGRYVALWHEFEGASSPEGRLVCDADKLEMMIQCLRYERAGSRGLDEFWAAMDGRQWYYLLCAELYADLKARRPGAVGDPGQVGLKEP